MEDGQLNEESNAGEYKGIIQGIQTILLNQNEVDAPYPRGCATNESRELRWLNYFCGWSQLIFMNRFMDDINESEKLDQLEKQNIKKEKIKNQQKKGKQKEVEKEQNNESIKINDQNEHQETIQMNVNENLQNNIISLSNDKDQNQIQSPISQDLNINNPNSGQKTTSNQCINSPLFNISSAPRLLSLQPPLVIGSRNTTLLWLRTDNPPQTQYMHLSLPIQMAILGSKWDEGIIYSNYQQQGDNKQDQKQVEQMLQFDGVVEDEERKWIIKRQVRWIMKEWLTRLNQQPNNIQQSPINITPNSSPININLPIKMDPIKKLRKKNKSLNMNEFEEEAPSYAIIGQDEEIRQHQQSQNDIEMQEPNTLNENSLLIEEQQNQYSIQEQNNYQQLLNQQRILERRKRAYFAFSKFFISEISDLVSLNLTRKEIITLASPSICVGFIRGVEPVETLQPNNQYNQQFQPYDNNGGKIAITLPVLHTIALSNKVSNGDWNVKQTEWKFNIENRYRMTAINEQRINNIINSLPNKQAQNNQIFHPILPWNTSKQYIDAQLNTNNTNIINSNADKATLLTRVMIPTPTSLFVIPELTMDLYKLGSMRKRDDNDLMIAPLLLNSSYILPNVAKSSQIGASAPKQRRKVVRRDLAN